MRRRGDAPNVTDVAAGAVADGDAFHATGVPEILVGSVLAPAHAPAVDTAGQEALDLLGIRSGLRDKSKTGTG